MIQGIDVSEHQRGLNVTATGAQLVAIKATEGETYVDPELRNHHRAAGDLLRAFYHLARPTPENDPVREADQFLRTIANLRGPGDVLALDWEMENEWDTGWALKWLDHVHAATGAPLWIYMSSSTANAYNWYAVKARYPLWLADPDPGPHQGFGPTGTRADAPGWTVAAWQYSWTGRLPGYGGNLDLDEVYQLHGKVDMSAFTLPTSRPITQNWAMEFYWFNGLHYPLGFYRSLGWNGHNGIDYGCHVGDPVEAVCDGVVEYVGPGNRHPLMTGGGNVIIVRHDAYGIRSAYLHLSQQNVYTGQRVKAWQVIGLAGKSGTVTAPHLHLEFLPIGNVNVHDGWRGRIDPTPYLYGQTINLAAGPTIITVQEDDMYTDKDRERDNRQTQILEAMEADGLRAVTKYLRSDHPDEHTLYEIIEDTGELRGISFDEWQASGRGFRTVPKSVIDRLPKV